MNSSIVVISGGDNDIDGSIVSDDVDVASNCAFSLILFDFTGCPENRSNFSPRHVLWQDPDYFLNR